jgi:hypothetical protein
MVRHLRFLLFFCFLSSLRYADGQPFDLSGPKVDVHVKRGAVTLPISEVPNLLPGDRLWIHPDLPQSQATHFVLIVTFLRGSTNPPPPEWFTRVETWTRAARDEGVFVTVPAEAQQALLFLAPETGGDFDTLRNAVRGRPGSFVRAAQDLQAASWERMRLEVYLADIKVTSQFDPAALKTRTEMAARSLGIKINESCFAKPTDEQASCLSQNSEGMVLDDANAQSRVDQLANGSTLDLMNQISFTSFAGGGAYSAYVGAIVDTAKILGSLHTAHFQYIPALALPASDTLNLRLNMPPSFRNPKSVVVVALPPVGATRPEPLHPVNPEDAFCATKPGLVLPAEGAPLFFATMMAHDLVLHIQTTDTGHPSLDLPMSADAVKGGLIPTQLIPALPEGEFKGFVRGKWGFDDWQGGLQFQLVSPQPGKWHLASGDQSAMVVGRDDTLHFEGQSSACVEKVEAQLRDDRPIPLVFKSPKPDALEVTVPLKDAGTGTVRVFVYQFGQAKPDQIAMIAYAVAASLDGMTVNSGDTVALLKGTRLDEVANAHVNGIKFTPADFNRVENRDQLVMNAAGSTASLEPGKSYLAEVELKDGRKLSAPVEVDAPRPQVALLSKGVQEDAEAPASAVQLGSPDDLPVEGRLVFFLQSKVPQNFSRDEKVEVAGEDTNFDTTLTLSDGGLMLENAHTAMATLQPLTRFGSSAFGPVHVRAISADGAAGDWLPLGTFVRLPGFSQLRCPRAVAKPCVLSGSNLFLAASFAAAPDFANSTNVAPEFTGTQIVVPHPVNGTLYIKLRDDPATVQTLTLSVTLISLTTSQTPAVKPPPSLPTPAPGESPATPPAEGSPGSGAATEPPAPKPN